MNTKIAVILTVLVILSIGMAVFILKDYVTIGKPAGEEAVAEETAESDRPEGEGAQTTLVAAATTVAGGTKVAGATTAAPATTTAGATTTTRATTAAPTTTAATTASLNITTTNPQIGGLVTTTSPGIGGLVTTTTQGMGVLITTTATGKADLIILPGGASVAFPNVKAGDTVTLSGWTVKNQGTAPSGSFKNGFYLASNRELTSDRVYLQGNSNLSLAQGEQYSWGSSTLNIPSNLTPGIYYIGVLVDRNNEVNELNESNNYVSSEIIVTN
jgi:hypothetical protein